MLSSQPRQVEGQIEPVNQGDRVLRAAHERPAKVAPKWNGKGEQVVQSNARERMWWPADTKWPVKVNVKDPHYVRQHQLGRIKINGEAFRASAQPAVPAEPSPSSKKSAPKAGKDN